MLHIGAYFENTLLTKANKNHLIGNSLLVKGCAAENHALLDHKVKSFSRHFYILVVKGFYKACKIQGQFPLATIFFHLISDTVRKDIFYSWFQLALDVVYWRHHLFTCPFFGFSVEYVEICF